MMNLYNLSKEYQEAFEELTSYEEFSDDMIRDTLEGLVGELKDKMINLASFIKSLEAEEECLNNALQNMEIRRARMDDKIESLNNYLQQNMENSNIKDISCPWFDIKIRKNPPSVHVLDEFCIPKEYIIEKIVTQIDKEAIKNAINSGLDVPGAEIIQLNRLVIK